ncbi:MAG TPA: TIGR03885 family FMN-dependent LLM class oxidoreductase [Microbacterium sp.]|uniref:TIGR03885 family FMN-dependent LLM class oxidoreductase n=1 Tax=Microbacterium sp. TaxID=51671 RepID=UPI002B71394D|nr:TIGR03885 family FMN-dependent LLM class oxidoreductase [Microbacterium sp.]HWI31027.1 TIGR03885 family FMN-dependent LLM class oxidoreductase [Microbacterium sp.]
MALIGYHASHEQLPPSALLEAVQDAEAAGFDGAMCSDHLAPWGVRQGESGYAWSWLGAALARTSFSFGVVTAPGQRYHPVITAQAIATLEEMFPGRFWACLGSGEAMNEHVTGDPWPEKEFRDVRLDESHAVIARLLEGREVDVDGTVRVHRARVWSRPAKPPPLFAAAVAPHTAAHVAAWADGLVTVAQDRPALDSLVHRYREAGGRGPLSLQVHVCLADDDASALAIVRDQWRQAAVTGPRLWDLEQPEDFDAAAEGVDDATLKKSVLIATEAGDLAEQIAHRAAAGFDRLYLHHVGKDQSAFIERAERELLPALRGLL